MNSENVNDDDIFEHIDWENLVETNLFDGEFNICSNCSPESGGCLSVGEIEELLMKDDDDKVDLPGDEFSDEFLSQILVDFPPVECGGLGEVVDEKNKEKGGEEKGDYVEDQILEKPKRMLENSDAAVDVSGGNNKKNDSVENEESNGDEEKDSDDPNSRKRKRKLRNKDAAVRSRERKKMYIRDLEMKSRYFEGECKRLGMLLQCFLAENHALRLSLQNSKVFDASTKQESAVLLLESLLLGSLLWFLGIICLLILPTPLWSTPERVLPENVDNENRGGLAPKRERNKFFELMIFQSFMTSKRCKASRSRMKPSFLALEILV